MRGGVGGFARRKAAEYGAALGKRVVGRFYDAGRLLSEALGAFDRRSRVVNESVVVVGHGCG
jgi:hypothetical protein